MSNEYFLQRLPKQIMVDKVIHELDYGQSDDDWWIGYSSARQFPAKKVFMHYEEQTFERCVLKAWRHFAEHKDEWRAVGDVPITMSTNKRKGEEPMSKHEPSPSKGLAQLAKELDTNTLPQKSEASTEQLLNKWLEEYRLQVVSKGSPKHPEFGGITFGAWTAKKLETLMRQREAEARLNGKQELIDIAAERAKNDEVYTLQAFIEDAQEYLIRVKGE